MNKPKIAVQNDYAELRFNSDIYSKEVLFAVGYHLLDKIYILVDLDKNEFVVYLFPQERGVDLKKLSLEFCNEMLNYGHYFLRLKTNAEAIKMLMQRALFSVAPSLVQEAEEQEIEELIKELEAEEEAEEKEREIK